MNNLPDAGCYIVHYIEQRKDCFGRTRMVMFNEIEHHVTITEDGQVFETGYICHPTKSIMVFQHTRKWCVETFLKGYTWSAPIFCNFLDQFYNYARIYS